MIMRNLLIAIIGAAMLTTISVSAAPASGPVPGADEEQAVDQPAERGGPADAKREEVRKKVEAVRVWRMTEALKLDEKTSTQLASFLSSIEEQRRSLLKANMAAMKELRASVKSEKPDERRLQAQLCKIEKIQNELVGLREKEISGIRG